VTFVPYSWCCWWDRCVGTKGLSCVKGEGGEGVKWWGGGYVMLERDRQFSFGYYSSSAWKRLSDKY